MVPVYQYSTPVRDRFSVTNYVQLETCGSHSLLSLRDRDGSCIVTNPGFRSGFYLTAFEKSQFFSKAARQNLEQKVQG